ncbi:hypothetical protein FF38_08798, partial [Lucilia cuprina]
MQSNSSSYIYLDSTRLNKTVPPQPPHADTLMEDNGVEDKVNLKIFLKVYNILCFLTHFLLLLHLYLNAHTYTFTQIQKHICLH